MMRKKSKKKRQQGGGDSKAGPRPAASSGGNKAPAASSAAAPLGSGRAVQKKVQKPTAKEQAALDKKAARANWSEKMTAEGR